MAPFDRPCTTFCWSAIVNITLYGTVFGYLTLNNIVTLKSAEAYLEGGRGANRRHF